MKDSEVAGLLHGQSEGETRLRLSHWGVGGGGWGKGGSVGRREGTDRGILPAPLYFQPSVKMNFTS